MVVTEGSWVHIRLHDIHLIIKQDGHPASMKAVVDLMHEVRLFKKKNHLLYLITGTRLLPPLLLQNTEGRDDGNVMDGNK